jgi:hypothetical protein
MLAVSLGLVRDLMGVELPARAREHVDRDPAAPALAREVGTGYCPEISGRSIDRTKSASTSGRGNGTRRCQCRGGPSRPLMPNARIAAATSQGA